MSNANQRRRGYISSGYILNSDGTFNGSLNTIDSSNKTSIITLDSPIIFQNVWGITSPNQNDQILVMTSDSKYISIESYLIALIIAIFNNTRNNTDLTYIQTCIYIALYIILTYGFSPSNPFIAIIEMIYPPTKNIRTGEVDMSPPPINSLSNTASTTSTPSYTSSYNDNYSTWNKLGSSTPMDKLVKDSYLFYVVCTDIAVNGKLSQYYSKFNDTIITTNDIKSSDWKYAANFFYTLYKLAANQQETFCITPTTPVVPESKSFDCRNNKSASSTINTSTLSKPTSTAYSILDYIFQFSYITCFFAAVILSVSQLVGWDVIVFVFNDTFANWLHVYIGICSLLALFSWFNTSIWNIDSNIVNSGNVAKTVSNSHF
jgi:hypothetical protein